MRVLFFSSKFHARTLSTFLDKHKVVQTSVSDRFFLPTNNSNDLQSNLNHTKSSESLLQTGGDTQSGMNKSVPEVSNALTQTGGKQSTRNRKQKTTFRVERTTNSISALNNAANKRYISSYIADEKYDLLTFLANMHTDVVNHLQNILPGVKANCLVCCGKG